MLPDICVVSLDDENDAVHVRIRVVDGEVRSIISQAVRDQHGISTAALLDAATRDRLRRCARDTESPTLVYSWLALRKCHAKIRSACGIRRGMACHECRVRSGKIWGLDEGGIPRCMACIFLRHVH